MKRKNPHAVALGRRGGKAGTGAAKARTSAQARAAVRARWARHRAKQAAALDKIVNAAWARRRAALRRAKQVEALKHIDKAMKTLDAKDLPELFGSVIDALNQNTNPQ